MMTLREFVTAIDKAVVPLFNDHGIIHPMWHVVMASGAMQVLPSPPTDDKDEIVFLLRTVFEERNVVRYVFIDEAWQVETAESDIEAVLQRGLEGHPDRVEVVMYSAEDNTGHVTARRVITRSKGGKPRLGPLEFEESKLCAGRFVGLLPLPPRGRMQ
jgi:hypothetical protein